MKKRWLGLGAAGLVGLATTLGLSGRPRSIVAQWRMTDATAHGPATMPSTAFPEDASAGSVDAWPRPPGSGDVPAGDADPRGMWGELHALTRCSPPRNLPEVSCQISLDFWRRGPWEQTTPPGVPWGSARRCFAVDGGQAEIHGWLKDESRFLRFLGIDLPAKNCTGRLSDAALAAFKSAFDDAGVCSVRTAEVPRPEETEWGLSVCADFGKPCEIRRTAAEWTRDPKLKRLLRAIEALAEVTCQ